MTTGNKSLDNLAPKYLAAIDSVSDERNNGDGWWIYLKTPFFNPQLECRTIHEQKLSSAIAILKGCVNNPITKEEYFNKQLPCEVELNGGERCVNVCPDCAPKYLNK